MSAPAATADGTKLTNSLWKSESSMTNRATCWVSASSTDVPMHDSRSHDSAVGWPRSQLIVDRTWPSIWMKADSS